MAIKLNEQENMNQDVSGTSGFCGQTQPEY